MKKLFNLQMYADNDPGDGSGAPGTAENVNGDGAAADQGAGTKDKNQPDKQPKYTDEDLDKILNKKFAKWQESQKNAVDEAKKLAEMDAQQKAEYERDQLKKQLDDYKRRDSIAEMTKTARKMLSDGGITVSDELLSVLVTTDAEQTKSAIDAFSKLFKGELEKAVKERLKGDTPRKGSGGSAPMTKEQIMAIRDPELRQKKMLENRELFNF